MTDFTLTIVITGTHEDPSVLRHNIDKSMIEHANRPGALLADAADVVVTSKLDTRDLAPRIVFDNRPF